MRRIGALRITQLALMLAILCGLGLLSSANAAPAPKPEKLPVMFGAWTGPGAGGFKGVLRQALQKDCAFVGKKLARVIIEGTLTPAAVGKGVSIKIVVKAIKTGEIVETREFAFPTPRADRGRGAKLGRAVIEIVRRAPTE